MSDDSSRPVDGPGADPDHSHSQGHSHSHSHTHSHGDSLVGGWSAWAGDATLRAVLIGVAIAAVATVIGVVALWPRGDGRQQAIQNAEDIGLVTTRLSATVDDVVDGPCAYSTSDDPQDCRTLTLTLDDGPEAGSIIVLPEINLTYDRSVPQLDAGDSIVLGYQESTNFYFYADQDRRISLAVLAGLFALVVIGLGRLRGVLALLAMATTLVVLVGFIAPSVLDGHDPLLVAVVGASAIAFVSLYLTHGFTPTTTVALAGTLGALALTLVLSWVFFELARITGLGSDEALTLPFIAESLNVSSLLLGGAVIGALGALDDVTVTQVATVAELRYRSPNLPTRELVASGIRVGRDHIASTVNTLLLAYAGASMPLLLLFAVADQSLDIVANSEVVAVEIIRTLCGSIGLVAAVPITTTLAAAVLRPAASGAADQPRATTRREPPAASPTEPPTAANPEPRWEDFGPDETDLS